MTQSPPPRSPCDPEAIQLQKLESLGQLAGGVAHDFNNILSIIDGYARIAKKESGDNDELVSYLDRIGEAVKRGSGLTRKLLAFGRNNIATVGAHDLGALVADLETLMLPLLDATYTLSVKTEKNIHIDTAPDWIAQIVMNLCINARDSMPDGGVIDISVTSCGVAGCRFKGKKDCGGAHACLRVTDHGCGMTDAVRSRIFDPFFTTKERGKGTGLGLSTVYGLVQQMGGYIDVQSAPGAGTTFSLYFPLSQSAVKKDVGTKPFDPKTVRFDGYVALVAEDEPDLLMLVTRQLEDLGMTVLSAKDGNEALIVQEDYDGDIDFLLTDVVMPRLNGVEMARLYESLRPDTHIIFMSGYPAGGQMARVDIPAGSVVLPKPVSEDTLKSLLYRLAVPDAAEGSALARMAGN